MPIISEAELAEMFPLEASLCIAGEEMYYQPIPPQESCSVLSASSKRRREFHAGRNAARTALLALGIRCDSIPMKSDRCPIWPHTTVGSITHCDDFCGAVVAKTSGNILSLGFDAEKVTSTEFMGSLVYSDWEASRFPQFAPGLDFGMIAFVAKEAFYKSYYPLTGEFLDFLDVSITISVDPLLGRGSFDTVINNREPSGQPLQIGQWLVKGQHVFASSVIVAAPPHAAK